MELRHLATAAVVGNAGGAGESVDRDGGSGLGAVELTSAATPVAVDWPGVKCGDSGGGRLVDRDDGSGLVAVELRHPAMVVVVDWSRETVTVVSLQWS